MTDSEFDDIVKRKLQQYEGDMPADMWQRITTGKRRSYKGYIWYRYLPALLLLLCLTGVYKFYLNRDGKTVLNTTAHGNSAGKKTLDTTNLSVDKNQTAATNKDNFTEAISIRKNNDQALQHLRYVSGQALQDNNPQTIPGGNDEGSIQKGKPDSMISDPLNADASKKHVLTNTVNGSTEEDINRDADIEGNNEDYDKFSLQLFISPDLPFSTVHSPNSSYEKLLNDNISMKLSYTIGASISIAVNERISLSGGVQYSRVNEKISGNDSLASKYIIHNYFNFINVPFLISFKTKWTRSFQTSLKAGILLNITSKYKGKMPDSFGALNDISNSTYLRNTGVSVYTAINLAKPVNEKFDLFAEPYFRFQTKNMADDFQPFTRKIQTAGLAFGIQYKLFREDKE